MESPYVVEFIPISPEFKKALNDEVNKVIKSMFHGDYELFMDDQGHFHVTAEGDPADEFAVIEGLTEIMVKDPFRCELEKSLCQKGSAIVEQNKDGSLKIVR
jgi:hypothetical protein